MAALALYLIGAPRSGKTAVFDALTTTPAGPNFTTRGGARYGTVKVPDDRLARLRDQFQPKKFTPAEVTFADLNPPVAAGEMPRFGDLTAQLNNADAFVLVVQAFGEFDFQGRPLDPSAQLDSVLLELVVTDLQKVENRLERAAADSRRGQKIAEVELKALERCKSQLGEGRPLRELTWREDEEKALRTYQFLSQKPLLVVANAAEGRLTDDSLAALEKDAAARGLLLLRFCATLETEIAALPPEEQREFLKDYGLTDPARHRLIRAAYETLRLISFFTVGEDEVRAWPIRAGTRAQAAAGKIHSDIERGFIRAETVPAETLLEAGSIAACRDRGVLRLEGKEYEVRDGDVINFRFNA